MSDQSNPITPSELNKVVFTFKDAVKLIRDSHKDTLELITKLSVLTDDTTPRDVTFTMSDGTQRTVANIAKIKSMMSRQEFITTNYSISSEYRVRVGENSNLEKLDSNGLQRLPTANIGRDQSNEILAGRYTFNNAFNRVFNATISGTTATKTYYIDFYKLPRIITLETAGFSGTGTPKIELYIRPDNPNVESMIGFITDSFIRCSSRACTLDIYVGRANNYNKYECTMNPYEMIRLEVAQDYITGGDNTVNTIITSCTSLPSKTLTKIG